MPRWYEILMRDGMVEDVMSIEFVYLCGLDVDVMNCTHLFQVFVQISNPRPLLLVTRSTPLLLHHFNRTAMCK